MAGKTASTVEVLKTTRQHPFYVDGKGWLPAGGLAIGNAIVTRAGPRLFVKSIHWHRRPQGYTVYNFEVVERVILLQHFHYIRKELWC